MVGDNVERLHHAVNTALSRSGLLIMTGAWGPPPTTPQGDHRRLRWEKIGAHQPSLERIQNYFNEKHVSENQEKQARLPEGAAMCSKTSTNGMAPAAPLPSRPRAGAWVIMRCPALPAI